MKSDLILRKYTTENVSGTHSVLDVKNFFGSKMLDIEDEIVIDNSSIQYSDVLDISGTTNGFQYFVYSSKETIYIKNLTQLKNDNHSIVLANQSAMNLERNTNWNISIDAQNILRYYLFYKLKESRAFKCVYYDDLPDKDINSSIIDYINTNIINRYVFDFMNFYVLYTDIDISQSIYLTDPLLRYDPKFLYEVNSTTNLVTNLNVKSTPDMQISAVYKQIKSSEQYKFDYYFNLNFKRL